MKKQYILGMFCIMALGYAIRSVTQDNEDNQELEETAQPETATDTSEAEVATKQQAIDLINKLIKVNATFAIKVAHPLLPGKVRLWQQRGLLDFPSKQVPWTTFIKDINEFGTHLHALLARNPQTGDYYHLPKLQKDAALYNNLVKIDQALTAHEPNIEAASSPFKLSKESLEALQKLINIYGTTFYQNKLLSQLEQLFKGFEPEAKKIRTEEEKAAAKAGRKKVEFEIPDFDTTDFDFDISTDTDFTTPSYDIDTSPDLGLDIDISDDFIKSFFD